MLKVATIDDLDIILDLGNKFIAEWNLQGLVDETKYKSMAQLIVTGDPKDSIILLHGNEGILAGTMMPSLFGFQRIATELMWYVTPSERSRHIGQELLQAFEYWAESVKAEYINLACLDDRVGHFYEKNGYELNHRVYQRKVNAN